ncbi:lactonase family protein [Devosia sp. YIM 151766]|uniref:lactonase family protein n=1 Tax=Devosia sp. YIM 151766 TaxID=3017325 RepID=UPI00255C5C59|nr:lactonase family protein [Devosia sp. YIM 151766]WIY53850.1 lactonase family protein [Devosia sp. YIM 151766]
MALYAAAGSLTRSAPQFAQANGAGVTLCRFDDEAGILTPCAAPVRVEDSTWLVADPARRQFHVVTDCDDGRQSALASLQLARETEALTSLGSVPAGGHEGCHAVLSADGGAVFVANYGGHRAGGIQAGLAIVPVGSDGPRPTIATFEHEGHGPNAARQESPHAHCVLQSPDGRFLFVADLGIDKLVAYELSGGALAPRPRPELDVTLPPGLGPRHFVFAADGAHLYLVSELTPAVTTLSYEAATGRLAVEASISLVAVEGQNVQPSGIVLHPDGVHLFVALRLTDEIAVLAIDQQTSLPQIVGRYPSGGRTPRDLALSPSGRFLLVSNQDADCITIWPVSRGELGPKPSSSLAIGTPMAVALAEFN